MKDSSGILKFKYSEFFKMSEKFVFRDVRTGMAKISGSALVKV